MTDVHDEQAPWGYTIVTDHDDIAHENGSEPLHGKLIIYLEDKPKPGYAQRAQRHIPASWCGHCKTRRATDIYSEGVVAYIHGQYEGWCKRCLLEKQYKTIVDSITNLPSIIEELKNLRD